jgi:glutamate-1-semialdehyde aminotransferase
MNDNVEENFPKSRIHSFLKDITELCKKHNASIYTDEIKGVLTTVLDFSGWEKFTELETDPTLSSVYWPRIESHIEHEEKVSKNG